jgi:hypothetical protein
MLSLMEYLLNNIIHCLQAHMQPMVAPTLHRARQHRQAPTHQHQAQSLLRRVTRAPTSQLQEAQSACHARVRPGCCSTCLVLVVLKILACY